MNNKRTGGVMRWLKGLMLRRVHGMITCKEFEDFVLSYIDGTLSTKQRSIFDWHLRLCRECREYLAAYQRTIEVAGMTAGSPSESAPQDVPDDLIRAILKAREA